MILRHHSSMVAGILFMLGAFAAQGAADQPPLFGFPEIDSPDTTMRAMPSPTGDWLVGTVTYHWVDLENPDPFVDHPGGRQVIAQIWYPASAPSIYPARYMPDLETFLAGLRTIPAEPAQEDAQRWRNLAGIGVNGTVAAAPARLSGGMPIVVFSPGGNMSRHWHTALMMELASHGYVAVALSHKYSTWDPFPAGGFRLSRQWREGTEGTGTEPSLEEYLAADLDQVLRRLSDLNAGDDGGHWKDRLDLGRIAVAGHSRGGTAATEYCATHPTIRACLNLDNIGSDRARNEGLDVPLLVLRSDDAKDWDPKRIEELHDFLRRNRTSAYEVVLPGANHNSFSDLPLLLDHYRGTIDPKRAHDLLSHVVLSFLERFMRGEEAAFPFAVGNNQGVTITVFGS